MYAVSGHAARRAWAGRCAQLAAVVNAVIKRYVAYTSDEKSTATDEVSAVLSGKLKSLQDEVADAERAVGVVNTVTGRGRHTSTSSVALPLPGDDGWVIDTAGIRSFGLAHVEIARIITFFPDLEPGTAECPRGCTHDEPDCALDAWVSEGHADPVASYLAALVDGDADRLTTAWPGGVVVHDPRAGEVHG